MKQRFLILVMICILCLTGCRNQQTEDGTQAVTETVQTSPETRWIIREHEANGEATDITMLLDNAIANEQFAYSGELSERCTVYQKGGKYLYGRSQEGGFLIWKEGSSIPFFETYDVVMDSNSKAILVDEKEGFLCTTEELWYFSIENNQIDQVMSLEEWGYSVDKIAAMAIGAEGQLLIAAMIDGEMVILERVEDSEWNEKEELEFAVTYASAFLREAIVAFNKENTKYNIVLRELKEGESADDYRNRIQAEVSSGSGPDLLYSHVVSGVINMEDFADNGYLRCLSEDFIEYEELLVDNVKSIGRIDDEIYGIPYSFMVSALVVPEEECNGAETWCTEELIKCVEESGADTAISYSSDASLCKTLLFTSEEKLIDLDAGICRLDSETAKDILEFAAEYGDKRVGDEEGLRVAERTTFAGEANISGIADIEPYVAMFQEKEAYVGVSGGNDNCGITLSGGAISINQACKHPEVAAEFIKYLLSEGCQNNIARRACNGNDYIGFPVRRESLDEMFSYAIEEQEKSTLVYAVYNGFEYEWQKMNEESLHKLHTVIENGRVRDGKKEKMRKDIMSIIGEETSSFFSGVRPAQEVCNTMQNRVQLYLDESR